MPRIDIRVRRVVAGLTAMLLATAGVVAAEAILLTPAAAAYPETVNPFSLAGGFTVYAREDLTLGNDETEGSLAAGGTTTLTEPTYSIIHVSAGTANYDLPTVDGDPVRLLTDVYEPSSRGIMQITSAGTDDPDRHGTLKMIDRTQPWIGWDRGYLRLTTSRSSQDAPPIIDAFHQVYPDDTQPPAGATGDRSVYTIDQSPNAVANYVEANADANYEEAKSCLDGLLDPTNGYQVGVAEDHGSRVVLAPLSSDRPNVVDYADIAGAALIQFSPNSPTPGVVNPLIIRVPEGTTTVIGASADPQGAYAPYMLWDLSELTGDVMVKAAEARIDGSIYAPYANVTVDASPLDGQVLGDNVTLLGGEVHSYLFAGAIACTAAPTGTFQVAKSLAGIEAGVTAV